MDTASLARLVALAAVWGWGFVWFRMAAPSLGAAVTGDLRAVFGGLALIIYLALRGEGKNVREQLRRYGWHFLGAGLLSAALPFVMFAYAAKQMPAAYLAIANATSPMWAGIMAAIVGLERLTARRIVGMVVGLGGVALVVEARTGLPASQFTPEFALGMAAALLATMGYGGVAVYIRKYLAGAEQRTAAAWSLLLSGIALLPMIWFEPPPGPITTQAVLALVGLSLACSAWGFLVYYRLLTDIGPIKTVTVTFLIPLFSILWGALFTGETVTLGMLGGCAVVLVGTWMVVRW